MRLLGVTSLDQLGPHLVSTRELERLISQDKVAVEVVGSKL